MGVSYSIVNRSFRHGIDRHGKPISFSPANLQKLNIAIAEMAEEIRGCQLQFGSSPTYKPGAKYDPSLVEGFQRIGEYFKLKYLTARVLKWKIHKNYTTLSVKNSPVYGNITREDADRINAELLAVSGILSSYEVVADENPTQSPTPTITEKDGVTQTAEASKNKKGKRKGMEQSFESPSHPWDNTELPLPERSRLFRDRDPRGVLLFRVNGGYTVEGDDARLVNEIDSSITPYTNVETGLVTAWMDSEQMSNILPRLIAHDKRVIFTDMYEPNH